MSQHLCKVTAGKRDYYLLTTELTEDGECDGFDVALCDGQKAWCGTVTADSMEAYSDKVHMEYDEMLVQTRKALTKDKKGSMNFIYDVKSSGKESLEFVWKKHVTSESIKFQLGSVKLQQSQSAPDVICQIFNHAIDSVGDLQEKINNLQSDNERLISERAAALKRLEKHVNAKTDVENDLYSKFVVVLNDKKSKLRELKNHNDSRSRGDSVADSVARTSNSGDAGSSRLPEGHSDDETDDDRSEAGQGQVEVKQEYDSEYNTDEDDKPSSAPAAKKTRKVKAEPLDSPEDASLMLDDGEADDIKSPVGRRFVSPEEMSILEMGILAELAPFMPSDLSQPMDEAKTSYPDEDCMQKTYICDKSHEKSTEKSEHTETMHMCKTCAKVFMHKKSLLRHSKSHDNHHEHVCQICGMEFARKINMQRHVNKHYDTRPYICEICQKAYRVQNDLYRHSKTCVAHKSLECGVCLKKFKVERHFKNHICSRQMEEKCAGVISSTLHQDHVPCTYICDICGKSYKRFADLKIHKESVHDKTKHVCETCGKVFCHKKTLMRHNKFHDNHHEHICHVCGMEFARKVTMERHVNNHDNTRPYSCLVCHKKFSIRSDLLRHMKTCGVAKNVQCRLCMKKFKTERYLQTHMNLHHT